MGAARRRLRVGLGVALAAAAKAAPMAALAREELAKHWAWAAPTEAFWVVVALTWAAVAAIAAHAGRSAADEVPPG